MSEASAAGAAGEPGDESAAIWRGTTAATGAGAGEGAAAVTGDAVAGGTTEAEEAAGTKMSTFAEAVEAKY